MSTLFLTFQLQSKSKVFKEVKGIAMSEHGLAPPHSNEAEQSVLGCILLSGRQEDDTLDEIFELLKEEDFYRPEHCKLFSAAKSLYEKKEPIDVVTISEHLTRIKQLDEIGGAAYVGELVNLATSRANIHSYATVIRDRSIHRALIQVGEDISKLGFNPEDREVTELIDLAERQVFDIAENRVNKSPFKALRPLLLDVPSYLDELSALETNITGFHTGIHQLDQLTAGLQRGDLIIVAGRPSMGKTTLAMNIADHIASHFGDIKSPPNETPVVGIFSMEMSAESLVLRMFSSAGSIRLQNLRTGNLDDDEWTKLTQAGQMLHDRKIFIDDQTGISAFNLRGRARRLKKQHPNLSLIVVDYLQLLHVDKRYENRNAEVTEISRILKEIARELKIPVIVISQLNRTPDSRKEKTPMMSDLRESGAIEQDADVIMFVHRPEVYFRDDENLKGKAELIVAKQRNGDTGVIKLGFQGEYSRFVNLISEQQESHYFEPE